MNDLRLFTLAISKISKDGNSNLYIIIKVNKIKKFKIET